MASASAGSKKTFQGGCHCGKIRYEVALDLTEEIVAKRCNCTICHKSGFASLFPGAGKDDFKLLSPSSTADVPDYTYRSPDVHRYFCDKCGIHVYCEGKYVWEGKEVTFFSMNLLSLDQPQDGLDVSQFKLDYYDGRHDNWNAPPRDKPWPGGFF